MAFAPSSLILANNFLPLNEALGFHDNAGHGRLRNKLISGKKKENEMADRELRDDRHRLLGKIKIPEQWKNGVT